MSALLDELNVVYPAYRYDLKNLDNYSHIPEYCGQCGAPFYVKEPWKVSGYDSDSGEPNKFSATLYCSKLKGWRGLFAGYHARRALIFTPAKFNFLEAHRRPLPAGAKKPKNAKAPAPRDHVSVLEIVRLGAF